MHKDLAYVLGFVLGDGNISKTDFLVRLYDQNLDFVKTVLKQKFVEAFGVEPGVSFDVSNNSYVLFKRSKSIWTQLHDLEVPAGRKARIIGIPTVILSADSETKVHFISGVIDAEGSITSYTQRDSHPRGYRYLEVKPPTVQSTVHRWARNATFRCLPRL